jgi:dTDP-4-dehydrorhamnose reductase
MKILILGSNGMAGHMIYHYLKETNKYEIDTIARNKATYNLDVTNFDELLKINFDKYDYIINCIGLLVKESNENKNLAYLINGALPNIIKNNTLSKIIHLSTDCVFSGETGLYSEYSEKDGKDIYAKSKSVGEISGENCLTIRTSIIGPEIKNGTGLFHWFMNQKEVKGYSQVYWNGITTLQLAKIIDFVIYKKWINGILNIPSKIISKYELLNIINKEFNKNIIINKDEEIKSNKTIISKRIIPEINHLNKSHEEMMFELKEWIENHKIYNY